MRAGKLGVAPVLFLAAAMISLLAGIWSALLRLGLEVPALDPALVPAHGPLMVSGFLGTLISLERAAALGAPWTYAAPGLAGAGALTLIAGTGRTASPLLMAAGSIALLVDFGAIMRRQAEISTTTMAAGAVGWLVGNGLWFFMRPIPDVAPWWIAFLVLTIMGERFDLSRMRGPRARDRAVFVASAALFCAGLLVSAAASRIGFVMMGAGLVAFAAWIAIYDVARATIRLKGLPRFGAVNLFAAAFWLSAGGVARALFPADLAAPQYDVVLHTIFLGFVFSMIFAHAPIIFPAILGKPMPFRNIFYSHVVLLHLSLGLRIGGDLTGSLRAWQLGGILNVVALLGFLANTAGAIMLGRARGTDAAQVFASPTAGARRGPALRPAPEPSFPGRSRR
jgi:hypothetical protein